MRGEKRTFRPARKAVVALAIAATLAFGVTSAQAANIVPNPGFETGCASLPCQWFPQTGATMLWYPVGPHTGARDMRMSSLGTNFIMTALSDCVAVTAGTKYDLSIWYRVAAGQLVKFVGFGPIFFSNADCTGSVASPAGAQTNSALADGLWHQITGQVTAPTNPPFNAQSAHLEINFTCTLMCAAGQSADFDDASMDAAPLAITISSLSARRSPKGTVVRWRTGSEADTLGFHLYREHARKRVRIDRSLILAKGAVSGARYSFRDRRAPHGKLLYRLQAVSRDGSRTWYGPARVGS